MGYIQDNETIIIRGLAFLEINSIIYFIEPKRMRNTKIWRFSNLRINPSRYLDAKDVTARLFVCIIRSVGSF